MPETGNNSENEYFAGLFGEPELTRRANWDGREESLAQARIKQPWELVPDKLDSTARRLLNDIIDIDHEVID